MGLVVRRAQHEDFAEAKTVYVEAWHHLARSVLQLKGERFSPSQQPITPTFVVAEEGRLLGFAEARRLWLHRLYVRPEAHKRGIGRKLLTAASSSGARYLWVDEANGPARALYESQGWRWRGVADPGLNWPAHRVLRYEREV